MFRVKRFFMTLIRSTSEAERMAKLASEQEQRLNSILKDPILSESYRKMQEKIKKEEESLTKQTPIDPKLLKKFFEKAEQNFKFSKY